MASKFVIGYLDADGDKAQVSFNGVTGNAANFDAQRTAQNALESALNAITLGNQYIEQDIAVETVYAVTPPTNMFAQVNIKWVMEWIDQATGLRYITTVPTADLAQATIFYNGAPALDLTDGVGLAVKEAFEDYQRHDGNVVVLNAIYFRE